MSDSTVSDKQPESPDVPAVEGLVHLARGSKLRNDDRRTSRSDPESAEALRARLDVVELELLTALDAVAGAEAERSASEARIRELEHQHHMLKVEGDELRCELGRLSSGSDRAGRSLARRILSKARRTVLGR